MRFCWSVGSVYGRVLIFLLIHHHWATSMKFVTLLSFIAVGLIGTVVAAPAPQGMLSRTKDLGSLAQLGRWLTDLQTLRSLCLERRFATSNVSPDIILNLIPLEQNACASKIRCLRRNHASLRRSVQREHTQCGILSRVHALVRRTLLSRIPKSSAWNRSARSAGIQVRIGRHPNFRSLQSRTSVL